MNFFDRLNIPRYSKQELLDAGSPPISPETYRAWVHRGVIDPDKHWVLGEAKADDLERLSNAVLENQKRSSHRRLYSGGAVLNSMLLQAMSRAGVQFSHSQDILRDLCDRYHERVFGYPLGGRARHLYREQMGISENDVVEFGSYGVRIYTDHAGKLHIDAGVIPELCELNETTHFTIIGIDEIIRQFEEFLTGVTL